MMKTNHSWNIDSVPTPHLSSHMIETWMIYHQRNLEGFSCILVWSRSIHPLNWYWIFLRERSLSILSCLWTQRHVPSCENEEAARVDWRFQFHSHIFKLSQSASNKGWSLKNHWSNFCWWADMFCMYSSLWQLFYHLCISCAQTGRMTLGGPSCTFVFQITCKTCWRDFPRSLSLSLK
jgi:hypothetical protein